MRGWSLAGHQGGLVEGPGAGRAVQWSPRMRGWSRGRPVPSPAPRVVPAHAGVVPASRCWRRAGRCGPRACGGGPGNQPNAAVRRTWSPRMRGWSAARARRRPGGPVVPAHAGVVPRRWLPLMNLPSGPRACGGGPARHLEYQSPDPWSPRMRGWSRAIGAGGLSCHVVPAHAGVVPARARRRGRRRRGPRTRGGAPSTDLDQILFGWWSPRARGGGPCLSHHR